MGGGGSGECDPRIEAIVKLKSRGSDSVVGGPVGSQVGVGVGRVFDECEPRIEGIVNRV